MQISILGCSGGIGGNLRTTTIHVDHDILVDAGTGVGDLSIAELVAIDHVFITHSHLDHVTSLPFLVDTVGGMRKRPVTVYGCEGTLRILRDHIFNWKVWPDFCEIPSRESPYMRFQVIREGETLDLDGRRITALPANHVVPAVGYQLSSAQASLVFTGDTTINDALWVEVNKIENLRYLIIETALPDTERDVAVQSKHLCPSMLVGELRKLKSTPRIYVTHLKPGAGAQTLEELGDLGAEFDLRMLSNGQVFRL
jgi:ribonuclease BN (tRNA processing enzyme)